MSPRAIAVTGSMGSGKSAVAGWLAQSWALPVYDADAEVKSLLTPGQQGWQRLRAILPPVFFDDESRLLKSKLRQAIFSDSALRRMVEQALHPLVLANLVQKTAGFTCPCLVEVPLLFEANWQSYFRAVVVVHADVKTCVKRITTRDGVTEAQALAALSAQMPIQDKIALADFCIDNGGTWSDTLAQIKGIKITGDPSFEKKTLDTLGS